MVLVGVISSFQKAELDRLPLHPSPKYADILHTDFPPSNEVFKVLIAIGFARNVTKFVICFAQKEQSKTSKQKRKKKF